jgi:hypothetical protein
MITDKVVLESNTFVEEDARHSSDGTSICEYLVAVGVARYLTHRAGSPVSTVLPQQHCLHQGRPTGMSAAGSELLDAG